MTLGELEIELVRRNASIAVTRQRQWLVTVLAPDGATFACAEHDELDAAVRAALDRWGVYCN
jgi:hypothetical protein